MAYKYIYDDFQVDHIVNVMEKFVEYVSHRLEQHGQRPSFSNGYLLSKEGYKDAVYVHGSDALNIKAWSETKIETGDVVAYAMKAMMIGDNNFVDPHQKTLFGNKIKERPRDAGRILYDFYLDKVSDEEGLDALAKLFGRKYDLLAYLFYLKNPGRFFPCRPTYFSGSFEELGLDSGCLNGCTYDNYFAFCGTILELRDLFYEHGWRDVLPIDVHSFLWMISPKQNKDYIELRNYIFDENGNVLISKEGTEKKKERSTLAKTRVNQTEFRSKLVDYWGGCCSVTGCSQTDILRASHIKPWRDCILNREAINVYNGLLLIPNIDMAFDSGYISFDDDGKILISGKLSLDDREKLGISSTMKLKKIDDEHRVFLKYHRDNIFRE